MQSPDQVHLFDQGWASCLESADVLVRYYRENRAKDTEAKLSAEQSVSLLLNAVYEWLSELNHAEAACMIAALIVKASK